MDSVRRPRRVLAGVLVVLASVCLPPAAPAAPGCRRPATRVPGGTWSSVAVPQLAGSKLAWRLAVDERDPRLVVIADSEGVLVSRDGGCRWTRSVTFADVAPPLALLAEDVDVAGTGPDRALHVLVSTAPDAGPRLLRSTDDGRTWEVADLPPATAAGDLDTAELSSAPVRSPVSYLLTVHRTGHGGVFTSGGAAAPWAWKAVTAPEAPPGACVQEGPCTAPGLRTLAADPRDERAAWGLATSGAGGRRLVRSPDGGATWEDVKAPGLVHGPRLLDVAAGGGDARVMLLDHFRNFAFSTNGGRSWQVGNLPKLTAPAGESGAAFDLAHAGRAFAALLGLDATSGWAGNVLVFDGRGWADVSPPEFGGYEAVDEDGERLSFTELTGSRRTFLMLSSRGELTSFLPAR